MIWTAIAALALLAAINRHIGRTFLYPPAMFAATWAAFLTLLWSAGDRFFPVSNATLLLFLTGAIAVSVGGMLTLYWNHLSPRSRVAPASEASAVAGRRLTWLLIALALALPVFARYIRELVIGARGTFWVALREQMVLSYEEQGRFHVLDNLVYLAAIAAMVACWEEDGSRKGRIRMYAAVVLALTYQVATAGRGGAVALLITLFAIRWLKRGKPSWTAIVVSTALVLVLFFSLAWFLRKGDIVAKDTVMDNAGALYDGFLLYAVGPIVAFDQATQHPGTVAPTQSLSRPFLEIANKFGARYDVPSIHAEFVMVGRIGNTNAYSMYFSYVPDFGVAGSFVLLVVIGMLTTWVFLQANRWRPVAVMLFGYFAASIALSPYAEYFYVALNFIAKIALVSFLLYFRPRRVPHALRPAAGTPLPLRGYP